MCVPFVNFGFDVNDRDQRQAYVAHLLEQAMQRGLVDDVAMDDGGAVALMRETEAVKPGGPAGLEVPLDADFAPSGLVTIDVTLVETLTLAASAA
jgi:hypothetical protein